MVRRIKTQDNKVDVAGVISNDLLLIFSSFVAGFLVPFLVWLWAVVSLSEVVLAGF